MKLTELKNKKMYLYESELGSDLDNFTFEQQQVMRQVEETLMPYINQYQKLILSEAAVTADQVNSIFTSAVDGHIKATGNPGLLKKSKQAIAKSLPVKTVRAANQALNDLGKKIQDTEPVQNFDALVAKKIQEMKVKLEGSPMGAALVKQVQAYGAWGKENPGKQAIIVAVITLAGGMIAGPAGGAIAGFVMRAGNDLIAGEKLSTAVGKAGKTAAIGALVGFASNWISDNIISNIEMAGIEDIEALEASMKATNVEDAMVGVNAEYGDLIGELDGSRYVTSTGTINGFHYNYDFVATPEALEAISSAEAAVTAASDSFSPEWYEATAKYHEVMAGIQNDPTQGTMRAAIDAINSAQATEMTYQQLEQVVGEYGDLSDLYDNLTAAQGPIAAAAQAAVQQADQLKAAAHKVGTPEEPEKPVPAEMIPAGAGETDGIVPEKPAESIEEDDDHLYELNFAGIKSAMGGTLAKAAKAVSDVGSITVDGLMNAWKKAGSPEDSASVRNIAIDAGIGDDIVDNSFTSAGIDVSAEPDAEAGAEAGAEEPADATGAEAGAEAGAEEPADATADATATGADDATADAEEPVAPADDQVLTNLAQMIIDNGMVQVPQGNVTHAGLIELIGESISNDELNKLMETIMKINEMCGCDPVGPDVMPEPKTNYNLNITQDDGNTHKTMNVTSDAPDELMKVLSLAGVSTGHSEPDGDEIVGVDLDGDEPAGPQSMGDLVQKLNSIGSDSDEHDHDGMTHSHPNDGDHDHEDDGDEYESVEQDPRSKPKYFSRTDLPMHGAANKKQPKQRTVSARQGDNPYLNAESLEEKFSEAYAEYKSE